MSTNETNNVNQPANIIRRLGLIESLYDDDVLNGSLILSRAFHTQVPRSYALNETFLFDALLVWTKKYPLLRARIHRPARGDDTEKSEPPTSRAPRLSTIRDTKFFAYMQPHSQFQFANVDFAETSDDELEWQRLLESELVRPFDTDNGPLWRLKLLKIIDTSKEHAQANTDKFVFIFSTHHSIGDGKQLHIFQLIQFDAVKYASFE